MKLSHQLTSIFVGLLIVLAYGVLVSLFTDQPLLVMLADVLSGLSVIGIAWLLFPYFISTNSWLAHLYLFLRTLEGILMIIGGYFFYTGAITWRDKIYDGIHLYIFIVAGFLFYYLLFCSRLIPRWLSVWGIVAILALLISTIVKLLNLDIAWIDSLLILIIANEVFLAGWLIIKGLNINHFIKKHD